MDENKKQGNPAIQVRLHPGVVSKVEKKAREAGYIMPSGKANLAGYVANLIMKDLNSGAVIIDGQNENYEVK